MGLTPNGYRHPPCIACKIAVRMGLRDTVDKGRCRIRGIGDVCGVHYRMIASAMTDDGGSSA